MSRPVTFVVTFSPLGDSDGIRGLRGVLKLALRRFGLRCVDAYEHTTKVSGKVSRCSTAQAARRTQGRQKAKLTGKATAMKMTKYAGASFIGVEDVRDGPFRGTIAAVDHGSYDKPVITFSSGQRFSLNKTNVGILIEAWGDESDDYVGERAELHLGSIPFQGEPKEAVLVRPLERKPGEKKVKPTKPKSSMSMDDDIPM
jgi:hypothetical protein